jgi:hypothetical protein
MNVKEHGASGDGTTLDSPAIQRAIDSVGAAGGGTVFVPPGRYRCGSVRLASGVNLHLSAGAVIISAGQSELFPVIATTQNRPGQIQAMLWADGAGDVSVTGLGAIDGGCDAPLAGQAAAAEKFRPAMVFFRGCRDVRFEGVTLRNSSFWTMHLMRCVDVKVRGVTIRANRGRINTDGIDPDGCRNVIISDCDIDTGDDCIVMKSTEGDDCRNVTVANCQLRTACAALKIGTESIGSIANVTMIGCIIRDSNVALALYMKDGGVYENILLSNLIAEASNAFPLVVDNTPRWYRQPAEGIIRNVAFENIVMTSAGRAYIQGLPKRPVENLTLRNIVWHATGPCRTEGVEKPVGAARGERDPDRINHATQPYHLLAIDARGLLVSNFRLGGDAAAMANRGLAYLRSVSDSVLESVGGAVTCPQAIRQEDCRDIIIRQ